MKVKIVVIIVFFYSFFNLGIFLDITKKPVKSDVIICLGGKGIDRIITSINLFKNNYSKFNKLYYIGKRDQLLWHVKNMSELKNIIELNYENIIYVDDMKNTMDEIIYIEKNIMIDTSSSILIVTDPPHSRRIDFMMKQFTELFNSKKTYTIVSSSPNWWDKNLYFLNFDAVLFSISEVVKIFYNYIKYSFIK